MFNWFVVRLVKVPVVVKLTFKLIDTSIHVFNWLDEFLDFVVIGVAACDLV